jgi:hypothetical protein
MDEDDCRHRVAGGTRRVQVKEQIAALEGLVGEVGTNVDLTHAGDLEDNGFGWH